MKEFSPPAGVLLLFLAVAVMASGNPDKHDSSGGVAQTIEGVIGGSGAGDVMNGGEASTFGSPYQLRASFTSRPSANGTSFADIAFRRGRSRSIFVRVP